MSAYGLELWSIEVFSPVYFLASFDEDVGSLIVDVVLRAIDEPGGVAFGVADKFDGRRVRDGRLTNGGVFPDAPLVSVARLPMLDTARRTIDNFDVKVDVDAGGVGNAPIDFLAGAAGRVEIAALVFDGTLPVAVLPMLARLFIADVGRAENEHWD